MLRHLKYFSWINSHIIILHYSSSSKSSSDMCYITRVEACCSVTLSTSIWAVQSMFLAAAPCCSTVGFAGIFHHYENLLVLGPYQSYVGTLTSSETLHPNQLGYLRAMKEIKCIASYYNTSQPFIYRVIIHVSSGQEREVINTKYTIYKMVWTLQIWFTCILSSPPCRTIYDIVRPTYR